MMPHDLHARELLAAYRTERDNARRDRANAQAREEKYELAVRGLEAVLGEEGDGDPTPPMNGAHRDAAPGPSVFPRGEAGVKLLLDEHKAMTIAALTDELQKRGALSPKAKNPAAATRQAFNRLREKHPQRYDLVNGKAVVLAPNEAGDELEGLHDATQGDGGM
jgi:hypothetical protein